MNGLFTTSTLGFLPFVSSSVTTGTEDPLNTARHYNPYIGSFYNIFENDPSTFLTSVAIADIALIPSTPTVGYFENYAYQYTSFVIEGIVLGFDGNLVSGEYLLPNSFKYEGTINWVNLDVNNIPDINFTFDIEADGDLSDPDSLGLLLDTNSANSYIDCILGDNGIYGLRIYLGFFNTGYQVGSKGTYVTKGQYLLL